MRQRTRRHALPRRKRPRIVYTWRQLPTIVVSSRRPEMWHLSALSAPASWAAS